MEIDRTLVREMTNYEPEMEAIMDSRDRTYLTADIDEYTDRVLMAVLGRSRDDFVDVTSICRYRPLFYAALQPGEPCTLGVFAELVILATDYDSSVKLFGDLVDFAPARSATHIRARTGYIVGSNELADTEMRREKD